jgi:hypothetical protein
LIDSLELYDEEIKTKLGTENLNLKPKAFGYKDGILIVGFE